MAKDKNLTNKLKDQSATETPVSLNRINQKPTHSGIPRELLGGNIPAMPANDIRLGAVRYDTPHLSKHNKAENFMVAILPSLLQKSFVSFFEQKFPNFSGDGKGTVFFNGYLHPDNIFFNRIENLKSAHQFPDILITSDLNSLYHKPNKLINEHFFETFRYGFSKALAGTGMEYPDSIFRFLAADAMVLVADKRRFDMLQTPREWYELLNPAFAGKIIFCGEEDFYNHTMYAHFVRDFGLKAVTQLVTNTMLTLHPSEMLEVLRHDNVLKASVYVMPFSYARLIENKSDFQIIWPEDGAVLLPIQMLVKKGKYYDYKEIIRHITSSEAGKLFASAGFIPVNKNTECTFVPNKPNWIGWDFLNSEDIPEIKADINHMIAKNTNDLLSKI
jgi:ABC-type Fe3+ transport system substrate-binding protein